MIRWCSYCQEFLGELAPFDDPTFTHGICPRCERRLDRNEDVAERTGPVRTLFKRLQERARAGDESACASILEEAQAVGLGPESILVGLLQPALYQAGIDWHEARMSAAAEHRFTSWCERVFTMVGPGSRPQTPVDLLLLQGPGNAHTLGPRFAAHVLRYRGLSVELLVPALPFEEVVAAAKEFRPRIIGLSCAMVTAVPHATEFVARLRERLVPHLECRYVLSGFAFRMGAGARLPAVGSGIEVVFALDYFQAPPSMPGRLR